MKSFWFNEDEIHRRRNRLRWLRIYWSRRLDIDYRGVTRLSPTRSQRNGPISDLTQRRMNSEVYPTLLRTPQCLPPYPPHSGTIPRIYRYTRPCSDSERNVKNMEHIDIMVYQWKSKLFFFRRRWCEKINLDVRFSSGAGFIQKKNYIWNLIFLLILRRKNHYVGLTGSLYD